MGYLGILNRGEGTWPIIKPAMETDLDAKYDAITLEFENMYRAADDIQRKTKQTLEIYGITEQLQDLQEDPDPVYEQEKEQDQMEQCGQYSILSFSGLEPENPGHDKQQVQNPAVHAFPAKLHGLAQAIHTKPRDPGLPSFLPAQFAGNDKQGDREYQPVKKTIYINKPLVVHFLSPPF
jgi:hypothetical protein